MVCVHDLVVRVEHFHGPRQGITVEWVCQGCPQTFHQAPRREPGKLAQWWRVRQFRKQLERRDTPFA